MKKQLKFIPMPSLKDLALRRIAVVLWNGADVISSTDNTDTVSSPIKVQYSDRTVSIPIDWARTWAPNAAEKVLDKMSKIGLPISLWKQMLLILNPIGLRIRDWLKFHIQYLNVPLGAPILEYLRWTTSGTIDYRKTAIELLRCEKLDTLSLYKLSCLYCLDECVPGFWKELPEGAFSAELTCKFELGLEFCWPHILKEECNTLDSICFYEGEYHRSTFQRHAFETSVDKGNKTAAAYFFQKLSRRERKDSLLNAAYLLVGQAETPYYLDPFEETRVFPPEQFADVFFYLFSVMKRRQRMQIYQDFSFHVLFHFVEWPWKDYFFGILDFVWESLTTVNHYRLAVRMIERCSTSIFSNKSNEYFKMFFEEFFASSPDRFRRSLVSLACRDFKFFDHFRNIPDCNDILHSIYRKIAQADRLLLVSSENFSEFVCLLIYAKKNQLAEECLRDTMLSDIDKETAKNSLKRLVIPNSLYGISIWDQFFYLLDKTTIEKRSCEIQTPMTSKRYRPTQFF